MIRTALVTGGSRGIGLATAHELLRMGHRVIITGRTESTLAAAMEELDSPEHVRFLQFDASSPEAIQRALGDIEADILVANVGMGFAGSIATTELDDWRTVMDTNVTSAFVSIRALLPGMLERGWGRIVTVGSMSSHEPIRHGIAYTASKHALLGLTRAVAADVAGKGVTVNMVAPAFVRTDMTTANANLIAAATGDSQAGAESRLAGLSTIGRLIEPDEVALEICGFFLAEADALNGQSIAMGFEKKLE